MMMEANIKQETVGPAKVLDHESRLVENDHHSLRLWLRLLTCTNLIEGRLRSYLREEFGTTLPRFDFMAQLERVPEGLTMGELSQRMMVSGGNVSGIAAQLEKAELITRAPVPGNRRSFQVRLTERGRREFEVMAKRHEEWVIDMLGGLSVSDVDQLMRTLKKVKAGIPQSEEH